MTTTTRRKFQSDSLIIRQAYRDTEGNPLPTPKARSAKAAQNATRRAATTRNCRPMITGREAYETRAYQYAMAMRGIETRHAIGPWGGFVANFNWDFAPDGSKRVRAVYVEGETITIPHWDFVPECVELTEAQGVFA